SDRDVEELLAERGLDVSYETVRSWVLKFGPIIARRLRCSRPRPSNRWHLDEMVVWIAGKHMYLWRAVDHEGEVLEILVQRRRDKRAVVKLMRKLLRKQGFAPKTVTTDKLRSYSAAFQHLGAAPRNLVEPERIMQVLLREALETATVISGSPHQPVSQPTIDVFADQVVGFHDRPLIEVAAPAAQ